MRTTPRSKRSKPADKPEAPSQPAPATEPAPAPTHASEPAAPAPDRLAVILNADGNIEIDSMRSATKDKLKTALKDPTLFSRLGLAAASTTSAPDTLFSADVCAILYGAVGNIMAAITVKAGYPVEQVMATVPFKPDEIEVLAPLTGKVLDKWIPMSGKYKDEAMLGLALFGIVNGKLAQLKKPATVIRMQPPAERTSAPEADASA